MYNRDFPRKRRGNCCADRDIPVQRDFRKDDPTQKVQVADKTYGGKYFTRSIKPGIILGIVQDKVLMSH